MEMDRWFEMAFHRLNREPPNPNVLAVGKRGFVVGRGGDPADRDGAGTTPCRGKRALNIQYPWIEL